MITCTLKAAQSQPRTTAGKLGGPLELWYQTHRVRLLLA